MENSVFLFFLVSRSIQEVGREKLVYVELSKVPSAYPAVFGIQREADFFFMSYKFLFPCINKA